MADYYLAQVNIARMRGSLKDSVMASMAARVDEMNSLAEQSKGFVWRIHGNEVGIESLRAFETYFVPFEPERLFYNMSVWESVDDLRHYVYRASHGEMLRNRNDWIASFDRAHLALWWIPVHCRPTIAESAERLIALHGSGPTPHAFTLKDCFPKPSA